MFPRNRDPSRSDLIDFIQTIPCIAGEEGLNDSIEFAIHAFATENYNGQFSNLYAVICASPVRSFDTIDRDWLEANDHTACYIYDSLNAEFAC